MIEAADVTCDIEAFVDYESTAAMANASFGRPDAFSPNYLEWLYEVAFGGERTIISARKERSKIGQAAILWHSVQLDGRVFPCAQLVDFFILPEHRSLAAVRRMYRRVVPCVDERGGVAIIVTVPNPKASVLNKKFLRLDDGEALSLRAGISLPKSPNASVQSCWFTSERSEEAQALMEDCVGPLSGNGVHWTKEALSARLEHPHRTYAVHRADDVCVITSFRRVRRVPLILVCALLPRAGRHVPLGQVRAILGQASRMHGCPAWLYVGLNRRVAIPGFSLSGRLRPSLMRLQTRALTEEAKTIAFDRFEAIDFDFA